MGKIANKLDDNGIPYMVIGGQAVLFHGEPRFTRDIDITLGIGIKELDVIYCLLDDLKLRILVENPGEFVETTMVLPVIDGDTGMRVDFIFSFTDFERSAVKRAVEVSTNAGKIRFAAVEDLIIHKVFSGRARDIEDARSIILKNPTFDIEHVKHWLEKFDDELCEDFSMRFDEILKSID